MNIFKKNEGFTLVELIVVIAILAILSGVAVPAYSGYITKTNMTSDQALVGEMIHALELKFYSEYGTNGVASIGVDMNGTIAGNDFAIEALKAVYGDTYTSLALKHDGWAGVGTSQQVLNHFSDRVNSGSSLSSVYNGTSTPTFANDIEDLFGMMQDVAGSIGGGDAGGADLVQNAAVTTLNGSSADDFANAWVNGTWDSGFFMAGTGSEYNNEADKLTGSALDAAIANAAVLKARNTVVAGYVRDNLKLTNPELTDEQLNGVYDILCNYNYERNGVATSIPLDAASILSGEGSYEDTERLESAIAAVFPADSSASGNAIGLATYYFETDTAKNDALAYYAMLDTVNAHKNSNADAEISDTYWEEMSDAVGLYASIVRGEASLEDLSGAYGSLTGLADNGIVITAMMKDGELVIDVSPEAARP